MRPVLSAAGALVLALALLLAGCTGKPPVLSRVMGRVIYEHDSEAKVNRETLGVFLVASDPDGMEDLSSFYVIDDEAELFWQVDSSSWVTATAEGETWIGTSSLSMPGGGAIPAGDYRVVLQAKGGATVEDSFTVPAREVSADQAKYPSATVSAGLIKVSGAGGPYEIWAYGMDGKFAGPLSVTATSEPVPVAGIRALSPTLTEGFTFRVFVWNASAGYGVLSGSTSVGPS